jgi:hypothetical protein
VSDYFKAKYPGNCRCCGYRFEKGVKVGQDSDGLFHKACQPPAVRARSPLPDGATPVEEMAYLQIGETFREAAARFDREARQRRHPSRRTRPEL